MMEAPPPIPTRGHLSRRGYVALLGRLFAGGEGGILEVRKGRHLRRCFLLAGSPVWYETGLGPEDLGDALVTAGAVEAARMIELRSRLSSGQGLREAILAARLTTEAELPRHVCGYVERGIAAGLAWDQGEWSFESMSSLPVQLLEWAAFGLGDPLRMLWAGVKTHVTVEEALSLLHQPEAGRLLPSPNFATRFEVLELEDTFLGLPAAVGEGVLLDDVFRRIPDRTGNLAKLLWLLVAGGLLSRDHEVDWRTWIDTAAGVRPDASSAQTVPRIPRIPEPPPAPPPIARLTRPGEGGGMTSADPTSRTTSPGQRFGSDMSPLGASVSQASIPPAPWVNTPDNAAPSMRSSAPSPAVPSRPAVPPVHPARSSSSGTALPVAPPDGRPGRSGTHPGMRSLLHLPEHGHQVREAHRQRAQQDYYTFLGISPLASRREVEENCNRLGSVWKQAEEDAALPDELRGQAHELLLETTLVWRTLGDEARRREYDRRLSLGTAPKLQPIRGAGRPLTNPNIPAVLGGTLPPDRSSIDPVHSQARRHMDAGEWQQAWPVLQKARLESPASPEVMTDLGWTAWHVKGRSGEAGDSAEDYLRLALTFDPKHVRALEYLARIGLQRGEPEVARKRLQLFLSVQPDSAWAKKALASMTEAEVERTLPPSTGSRLKFWKS